MNEAVPRLADPASCGEDLDYNARRAAEIAPRLCAGCEDYHIVFTVGRKAGHAASIETDRPQMADIIGRQVASRLAVTQDDVDVVIVGSSDTGLLATCAHAVAIHAPGTIHRVRFTVLDLCATPLQLCRDYGDRHGIRLETGQVDIVSVAKRFPADVIVHHSLSRFLPPESRAPALAKLGGWLKAGGRIVFSVAVESADREGDRERRTARRASLLAQAAAGDVTIHEPLETFSRRVANQAARRAGRQDFRSVGEVRDLIARSGLDILSFEVVTAAPAGGTRFITRERVLAVLAAASR